MGEVPLVVAVLSAVLLVHVSAGPTCQFVNSGSCVPCTRNDALRLRCGPGTKCCVLPDATTAAAVSTVASAQPSPPRSEGGEGGEGGEEDDVTTRTGGSPLILPKLPVPPSAASSSSLSGGIIHKPRAPSKSPVSTATAAPAVRKKKPVVAALPPLPPLTICFVDGNDDDDRTDLMRRLKIPHIDIENLAEANNYDIVIIGHHGSKGPLAPKVSQRVFGPSRTALAEGAKPHDKIMVRTGPKGLDRPMSARLVNFRPTKKAPGRVLWNWGEIFATIPKPKLIALSVCNGSKRSIHGLQKITASKVRLLTEQMVAFRPPTTVCLRDEIAACMSDPATLDSSLQCLDARGFLYKPTAGWTNDADGPQDDDDDDDDEGGEGNGATTAAAAATAPPTTGTAPSTGPSTTTTTTTTTASSLLASPVPALTSLKSPLLDLPPLPAKKTLPPVGSNGV